MRKLISYLAPYKKSVMIAVAFMLLDVVCEVVQPTLMSDIVGRGIQTGNIPFILGVGALMILFALLAIVAGFGNARHSARAGVGFAAGRAAAFSRRCRPSPSRTSTTSPPPPSPPVSPTT